jgi:alkaline phosphatase D
MDRSLTLLAVVVIPGLLASCALLELPVPPPAEEMIEISEMIVGHTTDDSVRINVKTTEPGLFRLTLTDADGAWIQDAVQETTPESASRAVVVMTGLEPRTEYRLRAAEREVGRFRTFPRPGERAPIRIGFGSCFNVRQDTVRVHPDGVSPERWENHQIWPALVEEDLDAFALIGDRFYLPGWYEWYEDRSEAEVLSRFHELDKQSMAIPGVAERLSTVPTYVIWDDHDYGPNNAAKDFMFKHLAMDVLESTYANPPMGEPGNEGCYFKVTLGAIDAFFLDGRSFRDSADLTSTDNQGRGHHVTTPVFVSDERGVFRAEEPLAHMHGERQMAWLRRGLLDSSADVKLIISGNQMLSDIHRWEAWYMYEERREFLDWLREAAVPGVVFIAGDRHQGYIGVLREGGAYPLYELTSSGLGVNVYPMDNDTPESPFDILRPGANIPHFGVVEYEPAADGILTLSLEGPEGMINSVRIAVGDLRAD